MKLLKSYLNIRKAASAAAALAGALLFTGCTFTASVDSLLSPPMLSERQQQVYDALTAETGRDIRLIYPRYGEYRSAFLFFDLDGDETEEAIVFYEPLSDSEGNVRVNIIDTDEKGNTRSVYDHAGAGTGIERVFFTDLGVPGKVRMAIGYTYLTPTEKTLRLYSYSDGILESEYSDTYYKVLQNDLNRDGSMDVVVVNCNNENHSAGVSIVTDSGGGAECTSSVRLSENTVDLPSVTSGFIGNETPALFVDGLTGTGNLFTEIIYCVNGQLRNPAYLNTSTIAADTTRQSKLYSCDIDGDGIVEIPTNEPFPGYRDMAEKQYITNWNVFDNYDIIRKYSSYTDTSGGYCFVLPVRWEGQVTVRKDNSTGDVVFYKYNTSLSESRLELMRITAAALDEAAGYIEAGYTDVKRDDSICILVKMGSTDDNLLLTFSEAANNMYII